MDSLQFINPLLFVGAAALVLSGGLHLASSARLESNSPSRFSRLMLFSAMASIVAAGALVIYRPDPNGPLDPWPHRPPPVPWMETLLAGLAFAHASVAAIAAGSKKAPKRQRLATLGATLVLSLLAAVFPAVVMVHISDSIDFIFCSLYVIVVIFYVCWWRWPFPFPIPPVPDPRRDHSTGPWVRVFEGFSQSKPG